MNTEEKKKWFEENCKRLYIGFDCSGIGCNECLYSDVSNICGNVVRGGIEQRLLEEAWAESHGYVKKEETKSKLNEKVIKAESDPINPDHYKTGKLQVIEQMMIIFGPARVANFCEVNAYKYHARAGLKGDAAEDHKKADWYMRLYERLEKFGCTDGEKAMDALREFLEKEKEKEA